MGGTTSSYWLFPGETGTDGALSGEFFLGLRLILLSSQCHGAARNESLCGLHHWYHDGGSSVLSDTPTGTRSTSGRGLREDFHPSSPFSKQACFEKEALKGYGPGSTPGVALFKCPSPFLLDGFGNSDVEEV